MKLTKVAVLVGSIRKESFSKKIALALKEEAPDSLQLDLIDLNKLEMYNQDLDDEGKETEAWKEFRKTIKTYDAVLFVTPEYNRSVPALMKNAIDIGSRPYGKSVWDGKPGAVVSVSPGSMGGFGANHHLRQTLVFLNVPVMQQPEAYIANVFTMFDPNGKLINDKTRGYLKSFMAEYASWVGKLLA